MNLAENGQRKPSYRLGGVTPGGDILFQDGDRIIEVGAYETLAPDGFTEVTLFEKSLRKWQYPHHEDQLTPEIKETILQETARLLKARGTKVQVVIKR